MASEVISPKLTAYVRETIPQPDTITVSRQFDGGIPQSLSITFQRTLRVSDNAATNALPPGLGRFPILSATNLPKLPSAMAKKGDFLIPMYQREAMWMSFDSDSDFAIKIHVGGVNAVSGEPARETEATMKRRLNLLLNRKIIQDYVVAPRQRWLDGIATDAGTVRQFVATPLGSGYSVEAQITGEDVVGGIQIEVIPIMPCRVPGSVSQWLEICIKTLTGKSLMLSVSTDHSIDHLKSMIQDREGIPPNQQRLVFAGKQLQDERSIGSYEVEEGSTLHLILRLRGGGNPTKPELGLAAGGLITQTIVKDGVDPRKWQPECGTIFNVQIINSEVFEEITGMCPPPTPVTAAAYAMHGFPYFSIYNEKPSDIKGNFDDIQSVNQLDQIGYPSEEKAKAAAEVTESTRNPTVLLDVDKPVSFRSVDAMEKEVRKHFADLSV